MSNARYMEVFLLLTLITVCTLLVVDYPASWFRWMVILESKKHEIRLAEHHDTASGMGRGGAGLPPMAAAPSTSQHQEEAMSFESLRHHMERGITIEEGVLGFDVKPLLKSIPLVRFGDNRVINKLQRAQTAGATEQCIIRISKFCGSHCDHYVQKNHSREWAQFGCEFASPCTAETRFVGNLTDDIMMATDVLVIVSSLHETLQLERLMARRLPGQIWVLYSRESPQHDPEYAPLAGSRHSAPGNPYNISITYSPESDIYFPYCVFRKEAVMQPKSQSNKTKLVTWMASNCHRLSWRRGEFVEELQKHLPIDTYGKCGKLGRLPSDQTETVLTQYKFYLAFENSECRHYITEKFWRTSLQQAIVPIVFGADREDYERIAPPNSFISVQDYSSMSEFIDYLHALDADATRYNAHLDWRRKGSIHCLSGRMFGMGHPEVFMCYLLRKIIHLHVHPETSWQRKTPDFASWWRGQCSNTTTEKVVLGFNVHRPKRKRKPS